jgi:hypothetical protein
MIGREGLVGINVFLGGIVTPDRAIVQLAGADYAGSRGFFLAHKFIATLLGVRREGVTVAAQKLQPAALIHYNRGQN